MSWNVSVIGRAPAVAIAAASAFAACKAGGDCEKAALESAANTVACLLSHYPSDAAVKVDASCSQDKPGKDPAYVSQCAISVTPVFNFVV